LTVAFVGFRRRWLITPTDGHISAAVEDDFHCMAVALDHDGETITGVRAEMDRWPWLTCPGAVTVVRDTFTGVVLRQAAKRGEKPANCTHLYDLALLAANHALDTHPTQYDVYIADAVDGRVEAELYRDGAQVMVWSLVNDVVDAPAELGGTALFALKGWIATLSPDLQEAARLLQWASLIAHGRDIPMERQSDATRMPPNCYTFQPERAPKAARIGRIYDFSEGPVEPLDHFDGANFVQSARDTKLAWAPSNAE
jgi:Protein of unknown function (DUF2889)